MYRAEVRDGYVYVIDSGTGEERSIYADGIGQVVAAQVTDDDEVTIRYDSYGGMDVKYRISTGSRL